MLLPHAKEVRHPREVLEMLNAFQMDDPLLELPIQRNEEGKMAFESYVKKVWTEGIELGRSEGIDLGRNEMISRLRSSGVSDEIIADAAGLTIEEIRSMPEDTRSMQPDE